MEINQFLLISNPLNEEWARLLERIMVPYGKLKVITRRQIWVHLNADDYKVIFIDAGIKEAGEGPSALLSLISQLREADPKAKIIVTTSSPTWRQARETIQYGAADYIRQSMDEKKQLIEIESTEPFQLFDKG